MRIAMVSEHASPLAAVGGVDAGGQNVHVLELSTALAAAGHEVTVWTRRADDRTPEVTLPLLDVEVPGVAEAIRAAGLAKGVPTAMLSRGLCGVARGTLVVNLPGSTGGVKDSLEVLEQVVHHALDQIAGGDH